MTLSSDSTSCPREGSRLCCKPKGLGNDFCTEHDDKNVGKYLNHHRSLLLTSYTWSPMSSTLCPAWLWLQTVSHQDLSAHPFFFSVQWRNLASAWLCFLSHIIPSHTPGKLAKTWKIIWLWLWDLSPSSLWEEYEGSSKERRREMSVEVVFVFRFLNGPVFNYDIFLPLSRWCLFS